MLNVRQEIDVQREDTRHTGRPSVMRVDSTRPPARSEAGHGIPGRQRLIDARDAVLAFPEPSASSPLLCAVSRMCSCSLPCWSLLRWTDVAKPGADVHRVHVNGAHRSTTSRHLREERIGIGSPISEAPSHTTTACGSAPGGSDGHGDTGVAAPP